MHWRVVATAPLDSESAPPNMFLFYQLLSAPQRRYAHQYRNRNTYGFFLDNSIYKYYNISIDTRIFDISYNKNLIYFSRMINIDSNLYSLYKGDYLYFNLRLKKNKFYLRNNNTFEIYACQILFIYSKTISFFMRYIIN